MATCGQCGRPAVIYMGENQELPLCIGCFYQFQLARQIEQNMRADMINFIRARAESALGIPGTLPRFETTTPVIHNDSRTFNNLNVDRSKIGAINYGTISQLDVDMSQFKQMGLGGFAEALQKFVEALANDNDISADDKSDAIDNILTLIDQFRTPNENKRKGVIKSAFEYIDKVVSKSATVAGLWVNIHTILSQMPQ